MHASPSAILLGLWLAFSFCSQLSADHKGTELFLSVDHLTFQVEGTSLEDTVALLRKETAKVLEFESPPVEIHRYANNPSTDANPWEMREAISIRFHSASTYDILKDLCDITGFQMLADTWRVGLFQTPSFSGQLPSLDQVPLGPKRSNKAVEAFDRFIIPKFELKGVSTIDAINKLSTIYTELSDQPSPTIGIIRYLHDKNENLQATAAITLNLTKTPAGEIARYIAELSGCMYHFNERTITFAEIPSLYHPKNVYIFPAKDIIRAFGKPKQHNNLWGFENLNLPQAAIWGSGYHERSGKVFIITEPESVEKIQAHIEAKKR